MSPKRDSYKSARPSANPVLSSTVGDPVSASPRIAPELAARRVPRAAKHQRPSDEPVSLQRAQPVTPSAKHFPIRKVLRRDLHDFEKFMGCVIASYLSMLMATSTYVEEYVTHTCEKRMTLQARLPARHEIVMRHMISVSTFSRPTKRSLY